MDFKHTFHIFVHTRIPKINDFNSLIVSQEWSHSHLSQRNLAMSWVLDHGEEDSVVYFADDDNTYDLRLFVVSYPTR